MQVFELFFALGPFFKLLVTPLEKTLTTELLSKDVELNLLPVGIFTFFLSCLFTLGKGVYYRVPIVWDSIQHLACAYSEEEII